MIATKLPNELITLLYQR